MVILTTLELLSRIQVNLVCSFSFACLFQASNTVYSPCFLASIRPHISKEQEDFIRRVTKILLDQRKCQDLITLDILHAYCEGPVPTAEARRPNDYSRSRKLPILSLYIFPSACLTSSLVVILICVFVEIEATKLRMQIRATAAHKKEEGKTKEGASSSAPKAIDKGVPKRKADGDDRPFKKVSSTPEEELPKKPSLPKHRAGKGLMTTSGPVIKETDRRLFTHKDYVVEMMESIIKDQDADPCAKQGTEELGSSGLFDLAWVCLFLFSLYLFVFYV